MPAQNPARMPALFLAHGSPFLLDDERWVAELRSWAQALPRPEAVLMISAHWEERPLTIGATRTVPLIYDFYGFPKEYYQVTYEAPGAPGLAQRVRELLAGKQALAEAPERGLDHGAYVPLKAMYPDADVPTLQISLPTMDPATLFEVGRALAPLREEGILIVGSGFLSHNLRMMDMRPDAPTPSWAAEFDHWAAETIAAGDVDSIIDYKTRAPAASIALPTQEHFVPVIVSAGSVAESPGTVSFPIDGFFGGSLTRRSVQFD
jgi:4,5-DOPA dioxygenase extradiol